jgi:uncharacterized membrane protein
MTVKPNQSTVMTTLTKTQNIFRFILGTFMLGAGISHLTFLRGEFQAQVPEWVPVSKDLTVILSGIVEVLLGLSLIFLKKQRIKVGYVVAIFFVLIFPGNISQFVNGVDAFGLTTDVARGIRLLFQPVLILWALWCTGAWQEWRTPKT